jgi:hypothetical protein
METVYGSFPPPTPPVQGGGFSCPKEPDLKGLVENFRYAASAGLLPFLILSSFEGSYKFNGH